MKASRESQINFNLLPAVAIGGPPHSGKSVLAYGLTQALRERAVPHYLLRAYPPDYEGDWFQEGDPSLVRHLRFKGAVSERWLPLLHRDIAQRNLPLIVDMGGLPTREQEALLDECTHAILLTPDELSRQEWAARFAHHGLVVLADLRSELHGSHRLEQTKPVISGTLAGLERGTCPIGRTFEALVERIAAHFRTAATELYQGHVESSPAEIVIDLERFARRRGWDPHHWRPSVLPQVLEYLPRRHPLALYGRGPNWLYAAISAYNAPAALYLFDPRLGWVEVPPLPVGDPDPGAPLVATQVTGDGVTVLTFQMPHAYLDATEAHTWRLPSVSDAGLILNGKLPLWLWTALARAYDAPPWIGVTHPQVQGCVIVRGTPKQRVGDVRPVPGMPLDDGTPRR
jgi:CRISPR-associated protein Csx3